MMRIVFLGPPGAGKGTQAKLVSERYQLCHISTGEMLRAAVAEGTALGREVQSIINQGHLVPDDLMVKLIGERISRDDARTGYILDGFPRTVAQAEALGRLLESRGEKLTHVLFLELSEEELRHRLEHRRGSEARADDAVAVQLERLRVYKEQTAPVVAYYEKEALLNRVDASGAIDEVHKNVVGQLGA